ncbi:MAG: SAV_2336 N-terminal domain-related protein [Elainellaceae cyanobacterium]
MADEPTQSIQRFVTLLRDEWARLDAKRQSNLDTEDVMDILWLAHHIQPRPAEPGEAEEPDATVTIRQGREIASPPPPQEQEPKVSVYTPPPASESSPDPQPGLAAGLPLQVPAANALRSQLDLARALRPLMRKIPSPTQCLLDEEATAVQIAEQGVLSPVLVRAPERWFDLAIVVENSPSLKLWEDTIAELQALVRQQGAFRQIRTWGLQGEPGEPITVSPNWQPTSSPLLSRLPPRPASTLLDPTHRRIIWLVSDCVSELWDDPSIYDWLEKWGKHSPIAIVQLLPERLWSRTALEMGQPVRFHAAAPGATHALLSAKARPIDPSIDPPIDPNMAARDETTTDHERVEVRPQKLIALPVISLEPEPVHRWAQVTTGVGDASVAGLQISVSQLTPQSHSAAPATALSAEQQVQQFCAAASITAQKLAGLMAAVPVSVPVAHLIQQTLLPQSRQVHLAEVFMGGLLDAIPAPADTPAQPTQYRFPEAVREMLIDAVPISKTTQVLDTVSAYISERLGLGTKSFTALLVECHQLSPQQQQAIQPFAEIALSTLRRLGGDYRAKADQLAPYVNPSPLTDTSQPVPPLQEHCYQTARVEVEPLQRFDFETATIEPQSQNRQTRQSKRDQPKLKWSIKKSPGYGWQRVEELGDGVQLELVEIIGGRFQMGSPENEPERFSNEGPQHEVSLNDFFMGQYPVTQAQWRAVAALPPVNRELEPDPSSFKGENRPVEQVSWHDAMEFCARLSIKTGWEYRLPTEAEWEYACRAGTTTPFHFGETIMPELANYVGSSSYNNGPTGANRGETTPVDSFPANTWGLYDMHGNVWEWCADHWHGSYADKPDDLKQDGHIPWLSTDQEASRSLRGGSWVSAPGHCRSAFRYNDRPDVRHVNIGFRVVWCAARTL